MTRSFNILHADHGLSPAHVALVRTVAESHNGFFIMVVALTDDCADLSCELYGPACGDAPVTESEVFYAKRGGRPCESRMVSRPARPCRKMVVCGVTTATEIKIFTAYGTLADAPPPREPWSNAMNADEVEESKRFWSEHAIGA